MCNDVMECKTTKRVLHGACPFGPFLARAFQAHISRRFSGGFRRAGQGPMLVRNSRFGEQGSVSKREGQTRHLKRS